MEKRILELQNEIEDLKEKLRFAEEVLDKAPCLLYINEIGKIGMENTMRNVYLNKYAIDQTGCSMEEAAALGSDYFRKVMHPDDFEVIDQSIEHLQSITSNEIFGGLYKFKSKTGEYRWHLGRCKVFKRNADGSPLQFINSGIELQEEFNTHNQMLELLKENKRLVNENTVLKLTKRERDVLKYLSNGDCAKKISEKLKISESTIISHRKNMLRKLNFHNTATLVNYAVENGLN
jgi:DNA-binding CsgD family transcriptional regulator